MVTIKDVARVAGVSTATVSRVVRGKGQVGDKCRAKVQKIVKQLGYRPNINARALVSKTSQTIGVVTPNLSVPFFGSIAQGVEEFSRQVGYKVMMANSLNNKEGEVEAIQSLKDNGCENIILHSIYLDDDTLIQLCDDLPGLILINRFISSIPERCVWLDNAAGGRMATEYLLSKGHQDIVILTSYFNHRDPHERIRGVKQAMEEVGTKITDDLIFVKSSKVIVGDDVDKRSFEGELVVKNLLNSGKKFSAIVAYNDKMAIEAINALQDHGVRIPEDVSVIGFDNADISTIVRPQLTTMLYPVVEMAKYATELSISLIKNKGDKEKKGNKTHLFMPTLVERDSVLDLKE